MKWDQQFEILLRLSLDVVSGESQRVIEVDLLEEYGIASSQVRGIHI